MKRIALLLVSVFCFCMPSEVAAKVVCFGDSITKRGYPKILGEMLGVETINAGVAGNSSAQALRRLPDDVLAHKPDVVVIFFGTNDLRADAEKAYVPIAKYAANLETMIDQCRAQGAQVVLCTLPPINDKPFFTRHEREPFEAHGGLGRMIEAYRHAASEVAARQKVTLVDLNHLLAEEPTWISTDGVHPSEAGNAIIAKHIAQAVRPLVFPSKYREPEDDPELPNVLLIGDSISIGYTPYVQAKLKAKADVFRIRGNGKYSDYGRRNLDSWIGTRKWDVIHFNWGLWDLCYRNPKSKTQGNRDKINGALTATPDQYRDNMTQIVDRLKKTGATLIWCATTPVPEHEAGRKVGDDVKYNLVAQEIMKANNIPVNDLHAYALSKFKDIQVRKGDVHFTTAGYVYLAQKVADEISAALALRNGEPR